MRYISIFTHEKKNNVPPTAAEIATMTKLIEEGMKAGWLIATEGVTFGQEGVRVSKPEHGDIIVTDGPFAEAKEHLGGLTILRSDDYDVVLGWAERIAGATGLPVEVRPFQGEGDPGQAPTDR